MQRTTGYFPTESLEPSGNRLFSRSALNEGYLFRGSLEIIKFLIKGKSIGNTFDEISRLYGKNWMENLLDNGFIEINSFRVKNSIGIKRKCFAYNELEKELKRQHYSRQKS